MKEYIEKEIFEMVYNWGKVGIVTDERCNAFQDLIEKLLASQKKEILKEFNQLYKNETETIEDAIERILK